MNQTMICEHPYDKQDFENSRCLACKKVMRLYLSDKGTTLEYLNPDVKVFKTKWGDEIKAYPRKAMTLQEYTSTKKQVNV